MIKTLDLVFNDSTIFKSLFNIISQVKDDITIEIICDDDDNDSKKNKKIYTKGTFKIVTLDSTKCAFIDLKIKSEYFSVFKSKNKTHDICLSAVNFNKILKTMSKDDKLNIYIDNAYQNKLFIEITDINNNIVKYHIKLYDNEKKNLFPKFNFNAIGLINGLKFHKICDDMSKFADDIIIDINQENIIITCDGDLIGGSAVLNQDNISIKFNTSDIENIRNKYSLKYLLLFEKCASYCDKIQLFFAENHPICIKYIFDDIQQEKSNIGQLILGISPINDEYDDNFSDDDEIYEENESQLKMKYI